MTGSFSDSATLAGCSNGSGGNSAERAQGQSVLQEAVCVESVAWSTTFFGAQQLRVAGVFGLAQQDFLAEFDLALLH